MYNNLKSKLSNDAELKQAFMDLLFDYAFENIDANITPPKAFRMAKEEYLEDIGTVKAFIHECLLEAGNEKDRLKISDMYRTFKEVFQKRIDNLMPLREFSKSLERHKLKKIKTNGTMYIANVKWKSSNDDATADFISDDDA